MPTATDAYNALATTNDWSAGQFTFSIATSGSTWPGYASGSEPFRSGYKVLSGAQASAFRSAITAWDRLIAPNFVETNDVSSPGNIRVAFASISGAGGYTYFPPSNGAPTAANGDVWLNTTLSNTSFSPSLADQATSNYRLMVHEIGHALGLTHPSEGAKPIASAYDNQRYSIMSSNAIADSHVYSFSSPSAGMVSYSWFGLQVASPMVMDIAAIQGMYGADKNTAAGNDTYSWSENTARLLTIYDAGGTDTIDLGGHSRASYIDLTPGAYSSVDLFTRAQQIEAAVAKYGESFRSFITSTLSDGALHEFRNNVAIAYSTVVENVNAGNGNDTIVGNAADNLVKGNGGNDLFYGNDGNDTAAGGAGNDTLYGGAGIDVAAYAASRSGASVSVNSSGNVIVTAGSEGTDTLNRVELLQFSDGLYTAGYFTPAGAPAIANFTVGAGGWTSQDKFPRHLGDVNGDGYGDVVGFGALGVYVSLGSSAGTFAAPRLVLSDFGQVTGWTSDTAYHREVFDMNKDGRADIVGFGSSGVIVSYGKSDGTFTAASLVLRDFGQAQGWTNQNSTPRTVADVNGDGYGDIVAFGPAGVYVALGSSTGAFSAAKLANVNFGGNQGWTRDTLFHRELADVNGDGRADIVGFGQGGVYVSLADSNGNFGAAGLVTTKFGQSDGWTSQDLLPRVLADVNGDKKADIVAFGANGTIVAFATGNGSFSAPAKDTSDFGQSAGWTSDDTYHREVLDVTRDGRADIVGFGTLGVYLSDTNGLLLV